MAVCQIAAEKAREKSLELELGSIISLLSVGVKFSYKVPSFSVLVVDLRKIRLQVVLGDKSVVILDGFIRADLSLEEKKTPLSIKLLEWCFVPVRQPRHVHTHFFIFDPLLFQVDEFYQSYITADDLNIPDNVVVIIWQWNECTEDEFSHDSSFDDNQDGDILSTDSDLTEDESLTSTVTFKCIGVTRDTSYQHYLEIVNKHLQEGKEVPVKLASEPNNPYDSRAISFQCELDKKWHVIGYVIKELCESVHEAITCGKIVSTKFAWVKYKVIRNTGPGFYAAIDITCQGNWPPIVHSHSNTMF